MKSILGQLIATLILIPCALHTPGSQADVLVIVNSQVTANADAEALKRLFLGKSGSLDDGTRLIPVYLPDNHPQREELGTRLLRKTPSQLEVHWSKLQFTGKGERPRILASEQEMIEFVEKNKTAIGYVSPQALSPAAKVRVLARF